MHYSLPQPLIQPMVQAALLEDLGRRADVTSEAVIAAAQTCQLHIVAREQGVLCGIDLARLSFEAMGVGLVFEAKVNDGDMLQRGDIIATVHGNARAILSAERTALNFLTHLSGIATTTQQIQASIAYTQAQVTCTRKTMPGLRVLQKFAVRVGGGRNHRLGLDDAILIKDNHIAIAGNIPNAIAQAKQLAGHLIPIEIEVDTLEQLQQAIDAGAELVLLDNMSPDTLRQAVALCKNHPSGRIKTEASGGITPDSVVAVAETGVDFIAMGYLTHSTTALDIGMDFSA